MLDLVAYDLRQPRSQRHLERGIRACSIDQRNVHYAPWFMETLVEPSRAIKTIRESLGSGREDDLLVLELGHNVSAACHNPHSRASSPQPPCHIHTGLASSARRLACCTRTCLRTTRHTRRPSARARRGPVRRARWPPRSCSCA